MTGKMILATLAAMLVTGSAFADVPVRGTHDPRINTRQVHQRERIQQGVRSGELTRSERRQAIDSHREVRQLERAYKSDGTLTAAERSDLRQAQRQASREIHKNKHDEEKRP